jgi:hypothetical protein
MSAAYCAEQALHIYSMCWPIMSECVTRSYSANQRLSHRRLPSLISPNVAELLNRLPLWGPLISYCSQTASTIYFGALANTESAIHDMTEYDK